MERINRFSEGAYILLGDAGYPLSPILLTPIVEAAENTPEYECTRRHCKTRCAIERVFGALKGRFRCLHKDKVLGYQPLKVVKFFKNCAMLHNLIIANRLENEDENDVLYEDDDNYNLDADILDFDLNNIANAQHNSPLVQGRRLRQHIIDQFFTV